MRLNSLIVVAFSCAYAIAFAPVSIAAEAKAGSGETNLDQQIATCMLLGNREEIALAQFAEEHAEHPQVKEFAKTLVAAHTKAVAMIEKAAPEVANLQLSSDNPANGGADRSQPIGHSKSATALMQAVKSECLSLTEKELGQYKGAEFDQAFIGQQLGAHVGMLAHLRGSNSFASPELQKLIAEGEKMTTMHMSEAKKIMEQLNAAPKTASTTQPATSPQSRK
ncbi:DUF4142 domain-containing protein [Lacipirellula parvula]|uniref:DUF4142 domain-containing protein n=1 Tax=Lacipirellula parvula TaxID=2650471 RepID=A0A5K7X6W4_9BACT|nr:DUF4142 domain-containing protein [Lacipirellula parvula]BBO31587.1 hypothetical protein PLANPX_1199 [Lacipirellula parvula]